MYYRVKSFYIYCLQHEQSCFIVTQLINTECFRSLIWSSMETRTPNNLSFFSPNSMVSSSTRSTPRGYEVHGPTNTSLLSWTWAYLVVDAYIVLLLGQAIHLRVQLLNIY